MTVSKELACTLGRIDTRGKRRDVRPAGQTDISLMLVAAKHAKTCCCRPAKFYSKILRIWSCGLKTLPDMLFIEKTMPVKYLFNQQNLFLNSFQGDINRCIWE